MEHWFDRTTKLLARDGVARRDVLSSLALTGMASLLPRTSWAQSILGEAAPPHPAPLPFRRHAYEPAPAANA